MTADRLDVLLGRDLVERSAADARVGHRRAVLLHPGGELRAAAALADEDVLQLARLRPSPRAGRRSGRGRAPLKPPMVTTGSPVAMMIAAVVCEPLAATRYLAEPWWAWRYAMSRRCSPSRRPCRAAARRPACRRPRAACRRRRRRRRPSPPRLRRRSPGPAITLLPFSARPTVGDAVGGRPGGDARSRARTAATAARGAAARAAAAHERRAIATAGGDRDRRPAATARSPACGPAASTASHAVAAIAAAERGERRPRSPRPAATARRGPAPASAATAGASALT